MRSQSAGSDICPHRYFCQQAWVNHQPLAGLLRVPCASTDACGSGQEPASVDGRAVGVSASTWETCLPFCLSSSLSSLITRSASGGISRSVRFCGAFD